MNIYKYVFILFVAVSVVDICFADSVNDVCFKLPYETVRKDYLLISSKPQGSLNTIYNTHVLANSSYTCYTKCCNKQKCNGALYYRGFCILVYCDIEKFDKCLPVRTKKIANYFLLRIPNSLQLKKYTKNSTDDPTTTADKTTHNSESTNSVSTSPTTTQKIELKKIEIEVQEQNVIYLPNNKIAINAIVKDDPDGSKYSYNWEINKKPKSVANGDFDGKTSPKFKLLGLVKGHYELTVEVKGKDSYGSKKVTIDVKPAKRKNHPPIAKIRPKHQTIELPNNLILDGSLSTDDSKIVEYHWYAFKGPILSNKLPDHNKPTLNVKDIKPGKYQFKLKVTDDDGAHDSDIAYATVLPEKDFPPKADPGENKIVELPTNHVILNGSNSTDDKKIISYQWEKKSFNGPSPDIQGANSAILHLSNLREGTYIFNLKVTDSTGQSTSKDVRVIVRKRMNVGPTAIASLTDKKMVIVRLPATEAVLNGSRSTDDNKIVAYSWKQVVGKPKLKLVDSDKPVAYVNDLKIGIFKFNLTVWDKEKLSSSDTVTLRVNEHENQPPKAILQTVYNVTYLETDLVRIDGSKSWDDRKIVKYQWIREDDSLAVGDVLQKSNHKPMLLLANILPGTYKFRLRVSDEEGLSDSTLTIINVASSSLEKYLVEIQFKVPSVLFTEAKKRILINTIELGLQKKINQDTKKAKVHIIRLDRVPFRNRVSAIFFSVIRDQKSSISTSEITTNMDTGKKSKSSKTKHLSRSKDAIRLEKSTLSPTQKKRLDNQQKKTKSQATEPHFEYMKALTIVEALNEIRNDRKWTFNIDRIETYICQNNCSGHGKCNTITKYCDCDTFWMASLFRERFGDGRPNCDWSIIYLTVLFIIFTVVFSVMILLIVWVKRRKCRIKKKTTGKEKKSKYMRLQSYGQGKRNNVEYNNMKVPKSLSNGIKSRSKPAADNESLLEDTVSDISSEESTLFQYSAPNSINNTGKSNTHINNSSTHNNRIHGNTLKSMPISSETYQPHDESKTL